MRGVLALSRAVIHGQLHGFGPTRYMSISGHRVVKFWHLSFSVQWRSFSVHQHIAMTISGHYSEQFRYTKCRFCYISILVHYRNASIYFIETLGSYVIRMLST